MYEASNPLLTFFDQIRERRERGSFSAGRDMLKTILLRSLGAGLAVLLAALIVPPLVGI